MHRPSYASISQRESFRHERLKLSENSIRLFQVQRGPKTDLLSLRITQYASHRRPPYKAISYTWGDRRNLNPIVVNGRAFNIQMNLWNLLDHLRQSGETSFLWADAICIDQINLAERNFHVQFMGRIYDESRSVVVWLGLPSQDRTEIRAMDLIREVAAYQKLHRQPAFNQAFFRPEMNDRWETLLRFCHHVYWTRTWIVQEFLRAPTVEVFCGTAHINWSLFEDLLLLLRDPYLQKNTVVAALLLTRPARLTQRRQAGGRSKLADLLAEYHDSACKVRQDKVYGIMGLASDCALDPGPDDSSGIRPDYKKHIVEVYLDTITCVEKSLEIKTSVPSAVVLVHKTLQITQEDVREFTALQLTSSTPITSPVFEVMPDYVGQISDTISSWISTRDLKQKLGQYPWGEHVGYEVRSSRPGLGRRSSARAVHSALPADFLQNAQSAADHDETLSFLHNYPNVAHLAVTAEHLALDPADKRTYGNVNTQKPCLIIERTESDSLRLGFACTNSRAGDYIMQFTGLDITLIARIIDHEIRLVGKAVMLTHSGISHQNQLDPIIEPSRWVSHCLTTRNPEKICLRSDALSLLELMTRN